MHRLFFIFLALSLSLIAFGSTAGYPDYSPIEKVLLDNGVVAQTDSVDSYIWSRAKVESIVLNRDSGPFEKGDSICLHKTFYVLGYRIVSNLRTHLLGNQAFTYRNYNTVVWLISDDFKNVFKIFEVQFGFPPSFNSSVSKDILPDWFVHLKSELSEPQKNWRSNILGLNFFD